MAQLQTWDEAFNVPPEILKNWQSQLQPGQSLLQFCLLQGHLPEGKYFPWAMGAFQLPKVRKDFFSIPPDLVFWELVKNRFAWSAELVPLAEWEGIMMIGCLTLPSVKIPSRHQFVLASAADLQKLWNSYTAAQSRQATTSAHDMETAATIAPPMLHAQVAADTSADPEMEPEAFAEAVQEFDIDSNEPLSEVNEDTNSPRLPGEQTRAEFEALADAHDVSQGLDDESANEDQAHRHDRDSAHASSTGHSTSAEMYQADQDASSESELNSQDSGTSSIISISFGAKQSPDLGINIPSLDGSISPMGDEYTQLDNEEVTPTNADSLSHSENDSEQESDEHSEQSENENSEGSEEGSKEEELGPLEGISFDTSKAATLDFSSLLGGAPASHAHEPVAHVEEAPASSAPSFIDSPAPTLAATTLHDNDAHASTVVPEAFQEPTPAPKVAAKPAPQLAAKPAPQLTAEPELALAQAKAVENVDLPPLPVSEFKAKPAAPPVKPAASLFEEAKQTKVVQPPIAATVATQTTTTTQTKTEAATQTVTQTAAPATAAPRISVTQMAPTHETSPNLDNSMLSFVSQISEANHSQLAHLEQKELKSCQSYEDLANQTLLRVQNIFENGMILMFQGGQLRPWKWTDMMLSVHGNTVKPIQIQDASIFRIVLRTSLPYHGYVVANPINDAFFNDFNRGKNPNHVTLVPILIERQISGIIMGLSDVEVDYKTSLSRMLQLAKDVSVELKRLREVKAA